MKEIPQYKKEQVKILKRMIENIEQISFFNVEPIKNPFGDSPNSFLDAESFEWKICIRKNIL